MHIRDLHQFLSELSENNNRAWFVMNKPRYDILRIEFLELVTALLREIGKFDKQILNCDPKKALFRINRDVRFAKDKSPYKTYFSASLLPSGRKKPSEGGGPAYYFHMDEKGQLLFAVGEYMPPADRVKAIRQRIIEDAAGFTKLLKNKALISRFGSLQEEGKLVRPPKGFDPEHAHIEQVKLKSFILWNEVPLTNFAAAQLPSVLEKSFKDGYPLVQWLRTVDYLPSKSE